MPYEPVESGTIKYVIYKFVSHWKGWAVAIGVLLLIGMADQPKKAPAPATTPIQYEQPR